MYLTQGLHRAIQRFPGKTALRHLADGQERATGVRAFGLAVARAATLLERRGVEPGDRVALLAQNSDSLLILIVACWWRGAVACPLNTRWTPPELRHAVADCGARLLLCDATMAGVAVEAVAASMNVSVAASVAEPVEASATRPADLVAVEPLDGFLAASARLPEADLLPDSRTGGDALAAILYTGGTTGRSKGVMLSHANLWSASVARAAELNNAPDSVTLLVAPLFHVAGLGRFIGQLIVGGQSITLPQFRVDVALAAIEAHGISDIMVVPTMLQALMDHPGYDAGRLQSLNRIAFGAAPMPPDLLARALAAWPKAEFFQAYGLTETAAAVCINLPANHRSGPEGERYRRSVGRAGTGAEIRVVDADGADMPRGAVGEIVVRGPMVMRGYWNQPEATAQALRDGWLHTGDGGWMDEDGYLFIADRLKDMIISGGENVYSAEVEAVLRSHPGVSQAAVIGLPDPHWGERVHAVIVPSDPFAARAGVEAGAELAVGARLGAELTRWCRQQLAGYKCPRSYDFIDALPLSAAGKVLKTELRNRYGAASAAGAAGASEAWAATTANR